MNNTYVKRQNREKRIRLKLADVTGRPRLHVYRSSHHIYAQIISDSSRTTIVGASEKELVPGKKTKTERAQELGKLIATKALQKKVTKVKFDRGSYRYHGRVQALANAARKTGLDF